MAISFGLSKLLSLLLYPLTQSMLLGFFALLLMGFHYRRGALVALSLGLAWLYLCSTAFFADFMMSTLEKHYSPRALSVIGEADAIVLLGGATRGDTHLGTLPDLNQQADRLVYTTALYKAGKAPVVLLAGGADPDNRAEAELMKDLLSVMGVPPSAMLLESSSRNTNDNALYAAVLLNKRNVKRILLVTSAFHMRRSVPLFERQGFEVIPAPTDYQRVVGSRVLPAWLPSVGDLDRTTTAIKEHVGYWVYRWRGWI